MGVLIEFLQGWTGWRTFDVADMVANTLGALSGWLVARIAAGPAPFRICLGLSFDGRRITWCWAADLERGAAWLSRYLGVTLSDVGRHPRMGTITVCCPWGPALSGTDCHRSGRCA